MVVTQDIVVTEIYAATEGISLVTFFGQPPSDNKAPVVNATCSVTEQITICLPVQAALFDTQDGVSMVFKATASVATTTLTPFTNTTEVVDIQTPVVLKFLATAATRITRLTNTSLSSF